MRSVRWNVLSMRGMNLLGKHFKHALKLST